MRQSLTPLVLLLSPAVVAAHNGSHTDMQGTQALMHQLLVHTPALLAWVGAGALGYALWRRFIYRRPPAQPTVRQPQARNIIK